MSEEKTAILEMKGISKSFPGVKALADVHFRAYPGEVMALLGENGAGKSTLMKILFGEYEKDSGTVMYKGKVLDLKGPREALARGICLIHQELNLISHLTVAENIFIGREPVTAIGRLDWKRLNREAVTYLEKLQVSYAPDELVGNLSIGQQQMVEIAKALSYDADVFILDEPTGALTDREVESLFDVIRTLRAEGKALVYISHRLKEIFEICDRATILRDGTWIAEATVESLTEDLIIEKMVGRKLEEQFPHIECTSSEELFRAEGIGNSSIKNVNFSLKKGEILGLTGLMGAGRTELALALFGADKRETGKIFLEGKELAIRSPLDAIKNGIIYLSEDRKGLGLFLGLSIRENVTISALRQFQSAFFRIRGAKEKSTVQGYIDKLTIHTPNQAQQVGFLSGGNQQKVSIAKGLALQPRVLIIDEPTRGIDVGAKYEIYMLLNQLKEQGLGVIMISSELPEILGMSDRILVMCQGQITGSFNRDEATQEKIMKCAINAKE